MVNTGGKLQKMKIEFKDFFSIFIIEEDYNSSGICINH